MLDEMWVALHVQEFTTGQDDFPEMGAKLTIFIEISSIDFSWKPTHKYTYLSPLDQKSGNVITWFNQLRLMKRFLWEIVNHVIAPENEALVTSSEWMKDYSEYLIQSLSEVIYVWFIGEDANTRGLRIITYSL